MRKQRTKKERKRERRVGMGAKNERQRGSEREEVTERRRGQREARSSGGWPRGGGRRR